MKANKLAGNPTFHPSILVPYSSFTTVAPTFAYAADMVPFNYSWVGHAANLTCKSLGEPAPHLEWYTTTGSHPYLKWQLIENIEGRYKIQGRMRRSNLEVRGIGNG